MRMNCCYCALVSSFIGFFTLADPLMPMEVNDNGMTIKPSFTNFVQGEPLKFVLTLTNRSAKLKSVNLGSDGVEKLRVTLTQDGKSTLAFAPVRAGFMIPVVLNVPSNGIAVHTFFLDDIVRLSKPDAYRISIQIVGADIAPAATEFCIVPNTEIYRRVLESRYGEMRKETPDSTPQTRSDIRKTILLSRHPLALQDQQAMLTRRGWQDQGEFEKLVDALVSSASCDAIESLVRNILASRESSSAERSVVLNRLREAHVEKWTGSAYKFLIPYLNDIKTSVPTVIGN